MPKLVEIECYFFERTHIRYFKLLCCRSDHRYKRYSVEHSKSRLHYLSRVVVISLISMLEDVSWPAEAAPL